MKKILKLALALILSALLLCTAVYAFDANDYDYGGGGGGWGGGGDWGGGGYSYDNDYSSSYSSSSGGSSDMTWEELLITIVVIVGFLVVGGIWASHPSKSKKNKPPVSGVSRPVPNRNNEIRDAVRQFDPSFTADGMISHAVTTFTKVQNAWCARDLEPVRSLMHVNLYNTTVKQVQSKIDQHVTYHYENITINNAYLTSYVRDSEYEYVTVYLNTKYIDYQTDDNTGNILRGDKTTMWNLRYLMKFMRSTSDTADAPKFCPNCGAPLDIASSGKCEYCGSTVTTTNFDWLLSDFTTVRADTKDDGIRINGGNK